MPQTLFYINRLHVQEVKEDDFEIRYIHNSKGNLKLNLYSAKNDVYFFTENKISEQEFQRLKQDKTIKIRYALGLLNKPFLFKGQLQIIQYINE
ncbi:MAG: hypothetical protein Wins2KO_07370 [Winogradskyella sp.]